MCLPCIRDAFSKTGTQIDQATQSYDDIEAKMKVNIEFFDETKSACPLPRALPHAVPSSATSSAALASMLALCNPQVVLLGNMQGCCVSVSTKKALARVIGTSAAAMTAMKIIWIDDSNGMDLGELRRICEENKTTLSALMITYPSARGFFEENIQEMCSIIYEFGGQVYMDGANMNAQLNLTSSGMIGADMCHLNLHKTCWSYYLKGLVAVGRRLDLLEPVPSRHLKEFADIKRSNAGVYIQNEFAQQFLETNSIANRAMLEEITVDMSAYHSRAIDGESVKETKRLYNPLIEKTVDGEVEESDLRSSMGSGWHCIYSLDVHDDAGCRWYLTTWRVTRSSTQLYEGSFVSTLPDERLQQGQQMRT